MQKRIKPIKESAFQRKFIEQLRTIPNSFWFVKEAKSIRGLADIFGCCNGHFVGMEVKRSKRDAESKTGRIVLQKYNLNKILSSNGFACFVYPENAEKVLERLKEFGNKPWRNI